jgi:putative peptide zinc metalloprotease protein
MGVAFRIMAPFAYTDTNDIWKLKDRKSRLLVDVAGVVSELIVAAWAIFLWGLLEPGLVKNIFYILGTITWINTLTVNLSPFMRFDGYYALSDYLRVSNLHARAAALTKWHFRKHVFGFKDEIPEVFPKPLEQTLILFSWATTLYRITVFLSIAYLIYHFFIKIVGIILFAIEIIWFVFLPIYLEIAVWMKRREEIRKGPLRHRSFNLLILVLFLVIFPWHFEVKEMGILKPTDRLYIYAPEASQIASPLPTNGDTIKSGQDMVHLSSIDLEKDMLVAEKEREIAEWKVTASAFNPDLKNNLQSNALNEKAILNNIEMLKSAKKELNTRAPFDGTYYELSPDLDQGDWLGKGAKLGVLVNPKKWSAEAYFPEEVMHRINVGQYAKFFPETAGNEVMTLKINSIDPSPTKIITDQIFTSQMGGSVVAKITGNKATTDRPYYKVTFLTTEAPKKINPIQRGHIVVYAKPESVLSSLIRNALVIYHRELSF